MARMIQANYRPRTTSSDQGRPTGQHEQLEVVDYGPIDKQMIEPKHINNQIEKSEKIGASILDRYSEGPPQNDSVADRITGYNKMNDLMRGFYYDH